MKLLEAEKAHTRRGDELTKNAKGTAVGAHRHLPPQELNLVLPRDGKGGPA